MRIIPFTEADIPEAARIEREVYTDPWTEAAFREALNLPHYLFLKAVEGDELAGYCGIQQSFEIADIAKVTVVPKMRGKGVGFRMLRELMEQGRRRGVERYTLEVRSSNARAIALYRKLGFEQEGVRKGFYRDPVEDALIFWTRGLDAAGGQETDNKKGSLL